MIVTGGILVVLMIISAAIPSEDAKNTSSSSSSSPASDASDQPASKSPAEPADPEKPNEATEDNAPHVASNQPVTVDGLVWTVKSVKTASTIGDPTIGTDEAASGVFVITTLQVHSTKGETATLTDNAFALEAGNGDATYSPDNGGTTAALLSSGGGNAQPFFL